MNKQEIIERLSADEDRCKYCNSSTVSGGDIYCSASHSHDMDCDGNDFNLDYKIEEVISALEKQLTDMWIPITGKLPDRLDEVMTCNKDGVITIGYIRKKEGYYTCEHLPFVTEDIVAWMPKPPKYEEVSDG